MHPGRGVWTGGADRICGQRVCVDRRCTDGTWTWAVWTEGCVDSGAVHPLMAHTHCMGPGPGQGPGNDGFLYDAMYCTHYTGTGAGTGTHCFLLCPSRSLSLPRSRSSAVCISHYTPKTATEAYWNEYLFI